MHTLHILPIFAYFAFTKYFACTHICYIFGIFGICVKPGWKMRSGYLHFQSQLVGRSDGKRGDDEDATTMKMMTKTWRPADKEWRTGGIQKNEGRGKPLSA